MSSSEPDENSEEEEETPNIPLSRSCLGRVLFPLGFLLLPILVLCSAVYIENLPIRNPISLHSRCRIVSSSVDLRSSKVCELGLLNYKAKTVLYPHERKKFRCRYDYYWASVFKVEYVDHSGQSRLAFAEAPSEALPSECRPNFVAAWLTKDRFKVNETYKCQYTLGISKITIYEDGLFNCQAKYPSTVEMSIRYVILFRRILKSAFASSNLPSGLRWGVVAGLLSGFFSSYVIISLARLVSKFRTSSSQLAVAGWLNRCNAVRLKRVCLFVAYVSFSSWLAIQYLKRIGLPDAIVYRR
ncbi:unnamed protein product [Cuscuta campestris]|uniref:Uncharacterized protein n=2 Tax=Cuscuta sect. Cleistogrammica TaxID=1824901 RepID=A0A484MU37_9ASTE|nr:hypothetical protein DM860_013103 [Cuscuta australis]VFQ92381.1 unnamed protein product [Cuscuta campestris]VFQ92387.1 unnamed protein product [Cuscuta campestris]